MYGDFRAHLRKISLHRPFMEMRRPFRTAARRAEVVAVSRYVGCPTSWEVPMLPRRRCGMANYQLINIHYVAVAKKFRIPRVCEISPAIGLQIINVIDVPSEDFEAIARNGAVWDEKQVAVVGKAG
jgi:hypothetical protein